MHRTTERVFLPFRQWTQIRPPNEYAHLKMMVRRARRFARLMNGLLQNWIVRYYQFDHFVDSVAVAVAVTAPMEE